MWDWGRTGFPVVAEGGIGSRKPSSGNTENFSLPEAHAQLNGLWSFNGCHCSQSPFMFFILSCYLAWPGTVLVYACILGIIDNDRCSCLGDKLYGLLSEAY